MSGEQVYAVVLSAGTATMLFPIMHIALRIRGRFYGE